ncbi:CD226 antigen isoform X3 [Ochotona curzoniae]|uniref:CD226 antigen isoform X3 n=1 Tax=Ochotona curzoniae TaxID=130825 RepID=UPI001B345F6D|nr:CD226 antigen isoform X3 [Ochotona curzoniae]
MDYPAFLWAILVYKVLCEERSWETTVKFAKNMTLECVYPSTDNVTQIEWFKINGQEKSIAVFNPTYGVSIKEPYVDRVSFLNSTMATSDMTLFFHNASEADVGFYSCLFNLFPLGTWKKKLLVVQSDGFEITVPPNSHIIAESGKNITLTHRLQSTWKVQRVTWERIQPHQIDVLASCNMLQGGSHTSKYKRQVVSTCSEGRSSTSTITIPQASASDAGLYRCRFLGQAGENETFVTQLTITDGKIDNQYILFVAGGTVLLLFVFLVTTIIVISRYRWPTTIDPLSPPLSAWTVKISMSTTLPSLADQRRGSSFPFCLSKFKTTIINMDLHTQHLYLGNQFTTLVSFDRKIVALSRKHSKWKCFRKSDYNNLFVCVRKCTESCIRTMQGSSSLNKGCLRRFPVSRIKHWHGLVSGSLPQCWAGILDVGLTHSSFPLGLPSGCQCLVVIQTLFFWCDSGLASPR